MDDMFFSADNKDVLKEVENYVVEVLDKIYLKINQNKIKYISENKKQVIMGILVNKKDSCLTKETKRKIRAVLHKYMTGISDNENYVVGYLFYVLDVDKEYFKTLNKYYNNYKNKYSISQDKIKLIGKTFNCNLRKLRY